MGIWSFPNLSLGRCRVAAVEMEGNQPEGLEWLLHWIELPLSLAEGAWPIVLALLLIIGVGSLIAWPIRAMIKLAAL